MPITALLILKNYTTPLTGLSASLVSTPATAMSMNGGTVPSPITVQSEGISLMYRDKTTTHWSRVPYGP